MPVRPCSCSPPAADALNTPPSGISRPLPYPSPSLPLRLDESCTKAATAALADPGLDRAADRGVPPAGHPPLQMPGFARAPMGARPPATPVQVTARPWTPYVPSPVPPSSRPGMPPHHRPHPECHSNASMPPPASSARSASDPIPTPPTPCHALKLYFTVTLDHLPTSSSSSKFPNLANNSTNPISSTNSSPSSTGITEPPISNTLMAALKHA